MHMHVSVNTIILHKGQLEKASVFSSAHSVNIVEVALKATLEFDHFFQKSKPR